MLSLLAGQLDESAADFENKVDEVAFSKFPNCWHADGVPCAS